MLAVQRPSMGSSKPPNLEMPFGYSFDTATNYPFPSPTAPAPGPSLLDDNESKFLESFFDGVSNDQFNYDFFNNAPDGSELGLGWDELPPEFMGTASSFGQQPQIGNHGTSNMNFRDMNPPLSAGPSIPPTTTADVLAAATLLQNGSNGRSQSLSDSMMFRQNPQVTPSSQPRAMSMAQQMPSRPQAFQQRSNSDDYMRDSFYTDMVFGPQSDGTIRPRGVPQKVDIRWGSDAGFASPQGFVAPAVQDDVAAVERQHMQAIETAFAIIPAQIASSAETTRPPSPARQHESNSNPRSHQRTKSIVKEEEDDDDQDSRPRKRRKNNVPPTNDMDEDDDDSPISSTPKQQHAKKRKSLKKGAGDSPATDPETGHKRRKSTGAAIKPSRENLTEDQKRENHIKSEQKRRTLIREGFEDLGELVPGLRGGGFSKSAVLIMAADWLEELIQGNEVLQARLDQMEGRG